MSPLLSMGPSISREAERLASLANGMKIGTIREQSAAPQRRVRSAGSESVKATRSEQITPASTV